MSNEHFDRDCDCSSCAEIKEMFKFILKRHANVLRALAKNEKEEKDKGP